MNKNRINNLLLSMGICTVFATIGGLLAGNALEGWFALLNHPWFSLPLWGWYLVGGLYYIMTVIILNRLLNQNVRPFASLAFWLTIVMIAGNEFWNFLFFGLESTWLGFISLIPFIILVIALFNELWKMERVSAWILLPYIIWLGYDLIWTYNLWKLNV